MKRLLLLLSVTALAAGCASMPGHVKTTESLLDGERQLQVKPGWLYAGGMKSPTVKLGGFWTAKSPKEFNVEVVVIGVETINGLKVGIDGKITEFSPVGAPRTEWIPGLYNSVAAIPGHSESSRRFVLPVEFVEQMIAGQRVVLQVSLGGDYVEGIFSFDQMTYARPAFRKVLPKINAALQPSSGA